MPSAPPFPILLYHALWRGSADQESVRKQWEADPQLRDPGARLYALDEAAFERQMKMAADAGGGAIRSWDDLLSPSGTGAARITFDDGHRSNREIALPILQSHGLGAIFFITTDWIGADGFMSEQQLLDLRRAGMLLGTHGRSHAYFSDLSSAELEAELAGSKARLEGILGEPVPALALPGGRNHPKIRAAALKSGYRYVFTSRFAPATSGADPLDLPRIAITQREDDAFLRRTLAGDFSQVEAMARSQRRRALAKRIMGNALYDRVRGLMIRR